MLYGPLRSAHMGPQKVQYQNTWLTSQIFFVMAEKFQNFYILFKTSSDHRSSYNLLDNTTFKIEDNIKFQQLANAGLRPAAGNRSIG